MFLKNKVYLQIDTFYNSWTSVTKYGLNVAIQKVANIVSGDPKAFLQSTCSPNA